MELASANQMCESSGFTVPLPSFEIRSSSGYENEDQRDALVGGVALFTTIMTRAFVLQTAEPCRWLLEEDSLLTDALEMVLKDERRLEEWKAIGKGIQSIRIQR
uniref:C-type lectin domain-containing protein n=1 Tax=Steinernema glaseri TaxID=37863 RepID=A0A1I7XYG4_9BILA